MKMRSFLSKLAVISIIGLSLVIITTGSSVSDTWKVPKSVSIVSTDIGASKYQAATAVCGPLSEITGAKFKTRPEAKGIGRLEVLRLGRSEILYGTAATIFFASYGKETFDRDGWGPQALRSIWISPDRPIGYMVRGDSGIKRAKDLKGKRVPNFIGYAALQLYMNAMLKSFAKDVDYKLIPVSGWKEGIRALKEGAVDVGWSDPNGTTSREQEASPHGVGYIQLPFSEKEKWAELRKIAPILVPAKTTTGAGLSKENPLETVGYNDRWMTYSWQDENFVYWFTKHLDKAIPMARGLHPLIKNWSNESAVHLLASTSPYHPGAIRYFKEIGLWGAKEDQWQEDQLAMEKKRIADWKARHPGWRYSTKGK